MINTIKSFFKANKAILLVLIDTFFYIYLFFGLFLLFLYGINNGVEPSTIAILYVIILIPTFILKAYKDNISLNFKRIFFNEK